MFTQQFSKVDTHKHQHDRPTETESTRRKILLLRIMRLVCDGGKPRHDTNIAHRHTHTHTSRANANKCSRTYIVRARFAARKCASRPLVFVKGRVSGGTSNPACHRTRKTWLYWYYIMLCCRSCALLNVIQDSLRVCAKILVVLTLDLDLRAVRNRQRCCVSNDNRPPFFANGSS